MPESRHKFIGKSSRPNNRSGRTEYNKTASNSSLYDPFSKDPHWALSDTFLIVLHHLSRRNINLITLALSFNSIRSVFSALPPVNRSHLRFTCEPTLTCYVKLSCQVYLEISLLMTILIGGVGVECSSWPGRAASNSLMWIYDG